MKRQTFQVWLEAAYFEFACYGPDFSLKALSAKVGLPRATLYYHFDNKDHLIQELLQYHYDQVEKFDNELKANVAKLVPDLYEVMYQYKSGVRFHQQLLRNNHIKAINQVYQEVNSQIIKTLLPVIRSFFNTDGIDFDIVRFFNTLSDAWFARINCDDLSVDYMCHMAIEILENTMGLYNSQNQDAPNSYRYMSPNGRN